MYGSYAHTEGEDDSVSASGTFSLASLAGSTKNYQRRMGQRARTGGGSLPQPVRIGSSKKTLPTPQRIKVADSSTGHTVPNFNTRLAAIEESDKKADETKPGANVSVSDLFGGLALNTPSQTVRTLERSHVTNITGQQDKISPDSGSFTMSSTKSRVHDTRNEDNFTDSLKNPVMGGSVTKTRPLATRVAPVRTGPMSQRTHDTMSQPPIRTKMTGARSLLTKDKPHIVIDKYDIDKRVIYEDRNKENVPDSRDLLHITPAPVDYKIEQHRDVTSRLQALAGSSQVRPIAETPKPAATPLPQAPQYPVHAVTPLPNRTQSHCQTPQAAPTNVPAVTPQQHAMPPPAPSTATATAPAPAAKEQVLVVRGKRYRVMKVLGKGGSSRVYEALDYDNNKVVAIKRVDLTDSDEAQREGFINEVAMLKRLQGHDRIVKLYDYENVITDTEELLYVVMEKGDTDLASLLKKYSVNKELTSVMIKFYWTEMLAAVQCIHSNNVIHKDLKPANFMLVAGRLKLIDFGIASSIQSDKTSITIFNQMGTFNYMSPESIQDLSGGSLDKKGNMAPCIKISCKTDVWSLGCILYQLTYGKLPFADIKHPIMKLQAITDVEHAIHYPPLPDVDPRLVSVIQSCLERDVRARASVEQLLAHSYVTEEAAPAVTAPNPAVSKVANFDMFMSMLSPNTSKKVKEQILRNSQSSGSLG